MLNYTFRKQVVDIDTVNDPNDDNKQEMDVVEITYPDGKVQAFPAEHRNPETGERYCDMFRAKYDSFKAGNPDADHVSRLKQEIALRQQELDAMTKTNDDTDDKAPAKKKAAK